MESDFPPLPSSGRSSKQRLANLSLGRDAPENVFAGFRGMALTQNGTKIIYRILSREGDAILEYVDTDLHISSTHYRWQVSSDTLMKNSPFFSALLDPNKFSEGRRFVEFKTRSNEPSMSEVKDEYENDESERLPLVGLNLSRLTGKHRIESLELFLKVLLSAHDMDLNTRLGTELVQQSVPVIAGLIEVADLFSSSAVIRDSFERAEYRLSIKGIQSIEMFTPSILKLSEERLRQIIYIAIFIQHDTIFRVISHALIILGSARWIDGGPGLNRSRNHRWSYLENGIEEELYYRRQCVMNTVTDLQAHFLRAYGALEEEDNAERSRPQPKHMPITAVSSKMRPLQCRWGFDNSRACDSFHLGEMIRFFSMRSKTIFLGSTLIDPGYDNDSDIEQEEDDDDDNNDDSEEQKTSESGRNAAPHDEVVNRTSSVASADILSITASLRQIPDYQIDPNHTGCGIRRRLLPVLDCIEGFIGHRRALIGLTDVILWNSSSYGGNLRKPNLDSWRSPNLSKAEEVNIRGAKVVGIQKSRSRSMVDVMNTSKSSSNGKASAPSTTTTPSSLHFKLNLLQQQREEARFFFTARKRNWES